MKPVLVSLLALAPVHGISAAVLLGSGGAAPNSSVATSFSLPSGTGTDWGYYHQTGTPDPALPTYSATNTSADGTRTFTVTALNGGDLRGPGSARPQNPE